MSRDHRGVTWERRLARSTRSYIGTAVERAVEDNITCLFHCSEQEKVVSLLCNDQHKELCPDLGLAAVETPSTESSPEQISDLVRLFDINSREH